MGKGNKIPSQTPSMLVVHNDGTPMPAKRKLQTITRNPFLSPQSQREPPRKFLLSKGLLTVGGQSYSPISYASGQASSSTSGTGNIMVVEKTEPILTIVSNAVSNTFRVQSVVFHAMQPNLTWLTNMANSFTSYEVLKVEFTYVPIVPTTVAGGITLAFQEDLRDDLPTDQTQMMAFEQGLLAPVYAGGEGGRFLQKFGNPGGNIVSFELPAHAIKDCAGNPKRFKVTKNVNLIAALAGNDGSVYSTEAYTPGRLLVGTDGVATSAQTLGQMFVRYRVRLSGATNISLQQ